MIPIDSNGQPSSQWVSPPDTKCNAKEKKTYIDRSKQIRPGRLCLKCQETANIRRKDQTQSKTELNMYVAFILGAYSKTPLQKSMQINNSATEQTSSLSENVVHFDVEDPSQLLDAEDDEIKLKIQLLDKP